MFLNNIVLSCNRFGHYTVTAELAETGREIDLYYQTDWDFPGLAELLGWSEDQSEDQAEVIAAAVDWLDSIADQAWPLDRCAAELAGLLAAEAARILAEDLTGLAGILTEAAEDPAELLADSGRLAGLAEDLADRWAGRNDPYNNRTGWDCCADLAEAARLLAEDLGPLAADNCAALGSEADWLGWAISYCRRGLAEAGRLAVLSNGQASAEDLAEAAVLIDCAGRLASKLTGLAADLAGWTADCAGLVEVYGTGPLAVEDYFKLARLVRLLLLTALELTSWLAIGWDLDCIAEAAGLTAEAGQ